ncbi:MAG: energy transducer TonB [Burkholderiaceae bacterium]
MRLSPDRALGFASGLAAFDTRRAYGGIDWRRAFAISVLLHCVVLAVHVAPGKPPLIEQPALEVIIVNSQTRDKPRKADALAQVALDGGGDRDHGRARSPVPAAEQRNEGAALAQARRQIERLEAAQRNLRQSAVRPTPDNQAVPAKTNPDLSERPAEPATTQAKSSVSFNAQDMLQSAKDIARLEAQVAQNIEAYNKRPRMHFFSPRTSPYAFALYEEAWREKVERFGNLNYPDEIKGRIYGQLMMTVYINADGSLLRVDLDRSSGNPVLDRAARRIVELSAANGFGRFPPEMQRQTEVLAIPRVWVFKNDTLETRDR